MLRLGGRVDVLVARVAEVLVGLLGLEHPRLHVVVLEQRRDRERHRGWRGARSGAAAAPRPHAWGGGQERRHRRPDTEMVVLQQQQQQKQQQAAVAPCPHALGGGQERSP